ncbi:acetyltransferase [Purpureocillium lavendulum]|uniref:Acetyltransferase n=1 Tax=Purpureocillium lavendulum TaxID=1247861 RepID=A0AB34G392_9HYPO|nr:acetyltransferase [Purpureocillium lavendulum]
MSLLYSKTQEKYYTTIVERYMTFCSDAGQRDELLRRFSSLAIGEAAGSRSAPASPSVEALENPANTKALSDVMSGLRKLREGIVASKRADDFAVQVYLFCIRLSVLAKQPESYHPAILYLLRELHPQQPLTSVELDEVVGYLVLDAACRRRQLAEAFALRQRYGLRDAKVSAALAALVHDNSLLFHRVKRAVDGHKARVMEWAEAGVRMHALKSIGKTYMSVDMGFLERMTGSTWDELKTNDGVGWELEQERVVIRRPRARTDEPAIEIKVKSETFTIHKSILTKNSEYFDTCLNRPYAEAWDNRVEFDDIEPKYMAYYLGLAASYSTIVPHSPPSPLDNPEAEPRRAPMRDYVEVYKLCDRFMSKEMGDFIVECLYAAIGDGHRALYRSQADTGLQKIVTNDFADAFEALLREHPRQAQLGDLMIRYFADGVNYKSWMECVDEVMNRPHFVGHVSKRFAFKLADQADSRGKIRRRELRGP